VIEGKRYDIGNKLDYLKTCVEYGLKRKEFSKDFMEFLRELLKDKQGK
jgi:UTP--glucose-1-phosphate uridylyltransferase